MANESCSQAEFIKLFQELGSPQAVANFLGISVRNVYRRKNMLIGKGVVLETTNKAGKKVEFDKKAIKEKIDVRLEETRHSVRRGIALENGTVVIFSDAHFYPQDYTTAFRALIKFIETYKPEVVICGGDAFDGSRLSRYPRINWTNTPTVKDELDAVKDHLGKIEEASTFKSNLIWVLGNHDSRFETALSNSSAHNYEGIEGFSLKDHFPLWQPCWSYWINDEVIIKHRYKGGRYAGYNNALQTLGKTIVTGHTHVLAVQPISAYGKTIYGVQTGCLANPDGDQFIDYTEDNPKDWRSGFAILTFKNGNLLPPELVQVWNEKKGQVTFRGEMWEV